MKLRKRTRVDVILEIEKFLSGRGGAYDWDDFTVFPISDANLDGIREFCATLPDRYPPTTCGQYCNGAGIVELKQVLAKLRKVES